eukprot:scaffold20.g7781.t1
MKCTHCGRRGAGPGCRVDRCPAVYHVPCAVDAGCTFYAERYLLACPEHAPAFLAEPDAASAPWGAAPHHRGTRATPGGCAGAGAGGDVDAGPTPAGAAVPMEQRGDAAAGGGEAEEAGALVVSPPTDLPTVRLARGKRSRTAAAAVRDHLLAARGALKRARRELEASAARQARGGRGGGRGQGGGGLFGDESSDDDEHFRNKEAARLARDTALLNPVTLGGGRPVVQHVGIKPAAKGAVPEVRDATNTAAVAAITHTDFSSLAGLDDVVRQLREMVLLPMQYPQLFQRMGMSPPRGILFHGEPGTGKTLAARALTGACAKYSPQPVTFFARKGADCLGKFHGEAERTLRLLFEEIYASVVSTLLALMDGVADRGSVIVIGATNRPEAIDPALRRPGRFDREVYFGLPSPEQRAAILRVHTRHWQHPPPPALLQQVAAAAEGYAGADLQALCCAAVMAAARRVAPALLELAEGQAGRPPRVEDRPQMPRLDSTVQQHQQQAQQQEQECRQQRWRQQVLDGVRVEPGDWRAALAAAPAPCSRRPGLAALSAQAAAPLAPQLLPLVAAPLRALLAALHMAGLPLPAGAAAAARAAADAGSDPASSAFEAALLREGVLAGGEVAPSGASAGPPAADSTGGEAEPPEGGQHYQPCRLLLAGEGEQGQEAAAGAALRLLEGCPTHLLSLPSLLVAGEGDVTAGVVSLATEALRRASPGAPCVLHLPRLEAWALSQARVPAGGISDSDEQAGEQGGRLPVAPTPHGATPRGGGGTPHRGFPVAPSPFSGLLPLEERGHDTPSVARALRALRSAVHTRRRSMQLLQPQQQQQPVPAAGAEQAAASGHPAPAVQLPLAPPPIRTSASPPDSHPLQAVGLHAQHQQQRQALQGVAAGSGTRSPQQEPEGEAMMEATRLSEAWSVFETLVKQAPPSQPLLVLATCHAPLDALPPLLLQFFTGGAPPGPAAGGAVGGEPCAAAAAAPAAEQSVAVVMMPGCSQQAWQQAAARAAEGLAAHVAGRAAAALRARLTPAAREQEAEDTLTPEEQQGRESAQGQSAERQGGGAVQQRGQEQQDAEGEQRHGQVAKEGEEEEQLNASELDLGLALFAQVDAFMRALGAALRKDRRAEVAGARVTYGGGAGRAPKTGWCSFGGLSRHAEVGGYASLDQLLADVAATARKIACAVQQRQERRGAAGPPPLRLRTAVTAACALQDEIEERCYLLRQQLRLDDPGNAGLLHAAAARATRQCARQQAEAAAAEEARRQRTQERQERQEEDAGAGEGTAAAEGDGQEGQWEGAPMQVDDEELQQHQVQQQQPTSPDTEQDAGAQQAQPPDLEDAPEPSFLQGPGLRQPQKRQEQRRAAAAAVRQFQRQLALALAELLPGLMPEQPLPGCTAMQALQEASCTLGVEAGAACEVAVDGGAPSALDGAGEAVRLLAGKCAAAAAAVQLPWRGGRGA